MNCIKGVLSGNLTTAARETSGRAGFGPGLQRGVAFFLLLTLVSGFCPRAMADGILAVNLDGAAPFNTYKTVFPNWLQVPTSSFIISECDDTTCAFCTSSSIVAITIMNYGTAEGGTDIANLYFRILCGDLDTGLVPMTYVNIWNAGVDNYPAWTWQGDIPFGKTDPCSDCECNVMLELYVDITPCPTDGRTIMLGPVYNDWSPDPPHGSILDSCGILMPDSPTIDPDFKTIRYVLKTVDKEVAAPGDTLNYTLFYGLPGNTTPSAIRIFDTIPAHTSYVDTTPESQDEVDLGPPMRLRWNLSTTLATVGGPTSEFSFKLTVDWGGEYCLNPQSGLTGAPELFRLINSAQMFWDGTTCGPTVTSSSPPTRTVVRRFIFWKTADQEALMAPKPPADDDQIEYSIFLRNTSTTKTWYRIQIWDTVPDEIDPWAPNMGLYDACLGNTMTPTGCPSYSPGYVISGDKTILTWKMDLPPGATIGVKWKGLVRPTTPSGLVATNIASVRTDGAEACFSGATGGSDVVRRYTHIAPIMLRTSYNTYVSNFGNLLLWAKCEDYGFWIAFYPLNRSAVFELYKKWHIKDTFANDGGVSDPIDEYEGRCDTGFPGNLPLNAPGVGCGATLTPAMYKPAYWWGDNCQFPYGMLYKLSSNSPLIWEFDMEAGGPNADGVTFTGSTNLSFSGFSHYTFRRSCCGLNGLTNSPYDGYGVGDALIVFNTGILPDDTFNPAQPTTVHLFKWDGNAYSYMKTAEIDGESVWMDDRTNASDRGHWKIISSDTKITIMKNFHSHGETEDQKFTSGRDWGHPTPWAETGNLVSGLGTGVSYIHAAPPRNKTAGVIVGNVSEQAATYEIWKYIPLIPSTDGTDGVPGPLGGSAGIWSYIATHTVDAGGILTPPAGINGNPHAYGPAYHTGVITTQPSGAYKIRLLAGGPIQIVVGDNAFSGYSGGAMLHASKPENSQTGSEFWVHQVSKDVINECEELYTMIGFCSTKGTAVTLDSTGRQINGPVYTTNSIDQAVSFQKLTTLNIGEKHNYRMRLLTEGAMVGQYVLCQHGDAKFFTAPFLIKGVFYTVTAPTVVFAGQPFWFTVTVSTDLGGTKTDYCGTTLVTTSDSYAQNVPSSYKWYSSSNCPEPSGSNDDGVHIFVGVVLNTLGYQTILCTDEFDGTITGLAMVNVVGTSVKLTKEPRFSVASSGDTVQFSICWSNYASSTAFYFTITDAVPMGTGFFGQSADETKCSIPADVSVDVAYSTVTPPVYSTTTALIPPGTRWLKWTVRHVNVNSSGCVCFKVTVD